LTKQELNLRRQRTSSDHRGGYIAIEKDYKKDIERPFLTGLFENRMLIIFLIMVAITLAMFIISISTDTFDYMGENGIRGLFNFALDYMLKLMGMRGN